MLDFFLQYRKIILFIVSIIICVVDAIIYIKSFYSGETKPHIYSYIIWFSTSIIAFLGGLEGETSLGIFTLLVEILCVFLIFIFALKFKFSRASKSDKVFLGMAFLGIISYFLIEKPLYSVLIMTFIDFCGFIPTIRKILFENENENFLSWFLNTNIFLIGLITLEDYSLLSGLYLTISFVMCCVILLSILWVKKRNKKKNK